MGAVPTYCVLFEAVNDDSAIAKAALSNTEIMLRAGWKVTVVSKFLSPDLRDRVEWIPLYVPPKFYALKWLTARWCYRMAIKGRTWDVVHGHQPQVADLSDVFQCHFLTRVAYEMKCLRSGTGLRGLLGEAQIKIALPAEDYFYSHWNPKTWMLFNSELTRREFIRLYDKPPLEETFEYRCPPMDEASDAERGAARVKFFGPKHQGLVAGYLGGMQERKGYRRLIDALSGISDITLLMGGSHGNSYRPKPNDCRMVFTGLVSDTASFYAACDVFIVPSLFEPLGMVCLEAAVRGTPVICTPEVGAAPYLVKFGAGVVWDAVQPLAPLIRSTAGRREEFNKGAREMAGEFSEAKRAEKLLEVCHRVLESKKQRNVSLPGRALATA